MIADIESLSVYALRYAMGRRSYAPNDVVDVLKRNWTGLSEKCRHVIKQDVAQFLAETQSTEGVWVDFYVWISKPLTEPRGA